MTYCQLDIDITYFEGIVNQNYPSELQLNKANSSDTEAPFPDLHLTFSDGFVYSKNYDKRDDFDIVNFPLFDGDTPRVTSNGVCTMSHYRKVTFPVQVRFYSVLCKISCFSIRFILADLKAHNKPFERNMTTIVKKLLNGT